MILKISFFIFYMKLSSILSCFSNKKRFARIFFLILKLNSPDSYARDIARRYRIRDRRLKSFLFRIEYRFKKVRVVGIRFNNEFDYKIRKSFF